MKEDLAALFQNERDDKFTRNNENSNPHLSNLSNFGHSCCHYKNVKHTSVRNEGFENETPITNRHNNWFEFDLRITSIFTTQLQFQLNLYGYSTFIGGNVCNIKSVCRRKNHKHVLFAHKMIQLKKGLIGFLSLVLSFGSIFIANDNRMSALNVSYRTSAEKMWMDQGFFKKKIWIKYTEMNCIDPVSILFVKQNQPTEYFRSLDQDESVSFRRFFHENWILHNERWIFHWIEQKFYYRLNLLRIVQNQGPI